MTVTVATAARIARVSAATIRTWCRRGTLTAVKAGGRWMVSVRSLAGHAPLRMPADHYRAGQNVTAKTGRAARIRTGNFMSIARRNLRLDALVAILNDGLVTAETYLRNLGANASFIRSYASPFGKSVATAWRAFYGCDPKNIGRVRVTYRVLRVAGYHSDDAFILDAGAMEYTRTAVLLGA